VIGRVNGVPFAVVGSCRIRGLFGLNIDSDLEFGVPERIPERVCPHGPYDRPVGVEPSGPVNTICRRVSAVAVAFVVVGLSGCESNNVGKLEDTKWGSAYVPDFKGISGRGVTMTLTFHADGRFGMGISGPAANMLVNGKWKLGSWDYVTLYDLSPSLGGQSSHMEKVTIAGDTMTMADSDGTKIVFTKIDKDMEKANSTPVKPTHTPASPNAKRKDGDQPSQPAWKHPNDRRAEPIGAYK
jgi:hypothetical protein